MGKAAPRWGWALLLRSQPDLPKCSLWLHGVGSRPSHLSSPVFIIKIIKYTIEIILAILISISIRGLESLGVFFPLFIFPLNISCVAEMQVLLKV